MAIGGEDFARRVLEHPAIPAVAVAVTLAVALLLWPPHFIAPPRPKPVAQYVPKPKPKPRLAQAKPAPPTPAAKPPGPSEFQLENRMTYAQRLNRWKPFVLEAAKRFRVPQAWIWAVMRMESGGRTMLGENLPITSRAGAMGLMQVMPDTYAAMRRLYGLGPNAYDPHDSILAGAAVLKILSGKYRYPTFFAAYNAGPTAVDLNLAGTRALPAETTAYIAGVTRVLNGGSVGGGGKVRLTRPDGSPVMIDSGAVVSIRAALPGEYAPSVRTVIGIGRLRQGVREDPRTASAIIGRGGRI